MVAYYLVQPVAQYKASREISCFRMNISIDSLILISALLGREL